MATTFISLKSTVLKMWILLDNTSTVKFFSTPCWSTIWLAKCMLRILCATGTAYTNYIADFPGCRTTWILHHQFFAHSLSLQQIKQQYCVTYDSGGISLDFPPHKLDTMKHCFHKSKEGLFYLDSQVDLN